jgi:hypothetical protein
MSDADELLRHAWQLSEETDEGTLEAIDDLLPALVEAGFAETTETHWRFTSAGAERARAMSREIREVPWPFEDATFPPDLGVVVMRTVLDGEVPALQVIHAPDDWWGVADGVNSPNGDASIGVHFSHVLDLDPSLSELATLPPGFQADRDAPGDPWVISDFTYGQ